MNRHERRANAKRSSSGVEGAVDGGPVTAPLGRPSLGLRLVSRVLLANWVLKRVDHPDLVAILLQIAQQVGRTDAIAALTIKLYPASR